MCSLLLKGTMQQMQHPHAILYSAALTSAQEAVMLEHTGWSCIQCSQQQPCMRATVTSMLR
jgi:hypothetical protein